MPHSSGGGSSSSGGSYSSHSSGGGSSYSSSSSSSSYSSSSVSSFPISKKPYEGASKYVYYDGKGNHSYFYKRGSVKKPGLGMTIGAIVVLTLIGIPLALFLMLCGHYVPEPLDTNTYDSALVIQDELGLVQGDDLAAAMGEFRNLTGVTPAVKIVTDDQWMDRYDSLEAYAYTTYVRLFNDECHWLVVLSYSADPAKAKDPTWRWEGMVGDDCWPVVSTKSEERFTGIMQDRLLESTPADVAACMAAAYREFDQTALDVQNGTGFLVAALLVFLLYVYMIFYQVNDFRKESLIYKSVVVPRAAREFNCEYCGSLYVEGTVSTCPNCAAPIPAHYDRK